MKRRIPYLMIMTLFLCPSIKAAESNIADMEVDAVDSQDIQKYAEQEVAFQVNLEKRLCEVLRPFHIRFYMEYGDQIDEWRKRYDPETDGPAIVNIWNTFVNREINCMVKAVDGVLKQICHEIADGDASVLEFLRVVFRLKIQQCAYVIQEQCLLESSAYKLRYA